MTTTGRSIRSTRRVNWRHFASAVLSVAMIAGTFAIVPSNDAQAQTATNAFSLEVINARTEPDALGGPVVKGDPITNYEYLINIDNTGDPTQARNDGCDPENAGYPDSCDWPSLRAVPGSSAIYTSGDQDDFPAGFDLPDGKYLVSVLADGYKVGGAHFTVPLLDTTPNVTVELHANPLPAATMRIKVFEDISPVNGQFDAPAEQGLAGFTAVINDTAGELSADVFGNPLCTQYDAAGDPIALDDPANTNPNCMVSDAEGDIVIPNVGPLRYDVIMVPPQGEGWIETTTLEGSPSWDTWLMEGGTGLDNEFVVAGEPFPWTVFGYVKPTDQLSDPADTGAVSGTIVSASVYLPQTGGLPYYGDIWNGFNGSKLTGAIDNAWVALSDLQNGDTAVYVGPANADGTYNIANVPDGDYLFTWFDENLSYILDWIQVTVADGEIYDMGTPFLTGWFTKWEGYVYNDLNQNGIRDPGEPGVPNYLVVIRDRDNSEIDRMSIAATTDPTGYYILEKGYPMGWWMVLEAYNDRFYTTGVTYQVENQPEPTTILGAGVDVGILPMLGQTGRIDWGVHPYFTGEPEVPDHGGIAGSVFYDTTRNELDARYQAAEPWAPGIPELTVNLYGMVRCGTNAGVTCEPSGRYELAPDGSYAKGNLLNTTVTESWEQPTGCTARDVNGNILNYPDDQAVFQNPGPDGYRCLEGPVMGTQFQSGFATLPGNYGFGDIYLYDAETGQQVFDGTDPVLVPMPAGDYLVEVETPLDARGRDMYQVVREEDINVFDGDQYVPAVPPPACAGALHTVDSSGNPNFADAGGSPYEGMQMPLCDVKLVSVHAGKSIAPTFTFFTEVPIPGRWKGYIIDDLALSFNKADLFYGEKAGLPNSPIGIYDWSNQLVTTVQSDPNGTFEVLLPSTHTVNCPSPSGVCSAMYYLLGNDPGQPGALNAGYNPQYRTIGATFEIYPGLIIPSDLAPTQIVVGALAGASQFGTPPQCSLDGDTPQLFAANEPYFDVRDGTDGALVIDGEGFGTSGQVTLGGTPLATTTWSSTQITATVPSTFPFGPHQLEITNDVSGMSTVNGLTIHVLGFGPFPATVVLDPFNRTGIGNNWNADNVFSLSNNNVRVTGTGTMRWRGSTGGGPVYGADQEAYLTFVEVSPTATEQGLFLKITGNGNNPNPTANGSAYIEVSYNAPTQSVQVRTKANATNTVVLQASFPTTTAFATGDQLGARALADGTVIAYRNGQPIGSINVTTTGTPWPAGNAESSGRLGVRFVGAQNNAANDARFDNFGGGTLVGWLPTVYEVGPGRAYGTIQSAVDAAAASAGDDLVVVYPGSPEQWNPAGNYFENVVVYAPVKIQGVGPGGFRADETYVPGTVVDGRGIAGDTPYADEWRALVQSVDWDGNQAIYEGAVFYVVAEDGEFTAGFNASIDGMTIQGGDQQGFPNNLTPGDPTIKEFAAVQGGGVFANAYVRNLQITNNVMKSNGGAYAGAIRIGTPHLTGALNDNQNENVVIADNRIIANGGTNLAGAIGLFSGSDGYEVTGNDICGNFSAEYGGGVSHYGYSPNGSIHDNRIYFNRSYDEGGGIMIAGELPADPAVLSPGAGAVNVYANLIQNNLANDDGGGLRFLMAGNFPYNVFNNIIVNNVSTHEGGGVSLNDTPNVRFMNNTVMKNITTATAVTSNGSEAPAGLSTSYNSNLLQATLPAGSPLFSDPLLFNNIFWDNRAGFYTGNTVGGIGLDGDPFPINYWDLGVAGGTDLLSPTNSMLQTDAGTLADGSNQIGVDPLVVSAYETGITVLPWRGNPRFVDVLMVVVDPAANVLGDYHLQSTSTAINGGASAKNGILAPTVDYDGQTRADFDIGADEYVEVGP